MVTGEFCCKQLTLWQREHPDPLLAEFLRTALQELNSGAKGSFVLGRGLFVILHAGGLKPELTLRALQLARFPTTSQ